MTFSLKAALMNSILVGAKDRQGRDYLCAADLELYEILAELTFRHFDAKYEVLGLEIPQTQLQVPTDQKVSEIHKDLFEETIPAFLKESFHGVQDSSLENRGSESKGDFPASPGIDSKH